MLPKNPIDFAFSILRDFYHLTDEEIAGLDPDSFVGQLKRIYRGLNIEHEFAAVAAWLGRCKIVTHADEVYWTDGDLRVPDYLIVPLIKGHEIPLLVEVKTENEDKLVWSEKYFRSLQRFADHLKMPLLVAWKRHGLWMLCDTAHFAIAQTAYHLSFDCAVKNNLMAAILGNVFITVKEGFRFELTYELLDVSDAAPEPLPEGKYRAQVSDAALYTGKGRVPDELTAGLFPIFLMKASDHPQTEREGRFLRHIFPVDPEGMFNLSELLFTKLTWHRDDPAIDWIAEIRKGLPKHTTDLHEILKHALDVGAVQYVFHQQPSVTPNFLEGLLSNDSEEK